MTHEAYPWTRRPDTMVGGKLVKGESSQAYEAFRVYMNLGSVRSVDQVSKDIGKATSLLRRWSGQWDWVNRAAAYDSYLVNAKVDGEADEFAKVRNSHLEVATKLLAHLMESMTLWKPGYDPSLRWTTAFTAAAKVQQTALTLKETTSKTDEEAIRRILEIVSKGEQE